MKAEMKLWYYNNVKRHRDNLRLWLMWRSEKKRGNWTPRVCPRAGRISKETMEWATAALQEIESVQSSEPNHKDVSTFRGELERRKAADQA